MASTLRQPAAVSESKRERDVYRCYGPCIADMPLLDGAGPANSSPLPPDYIPQRASDSTLTALAQLAVIRLQGTHALISLVDGQRQHILAEATPSLALRAATTPGSDGLWLGRVSIPRAWGICERVVCVEPGTAKTEWGTVIIKDLSSDENLASQMYAREGSRPNFYAGFALVSPGGAIVGALCVYDEKPRPEGLSAADISYMQDLAATITDYLEGYVLKDGFQRGEQLTRGLLSFAEGGAALRPYDTGDHDFPPPNPAEHVSAPGPNYVPPTIAKHESTPSSAAVASAEPTVIEDFAPLPPGLALQTDSNFLSTTKARSVVTDGNGSLLDLQNSILPANSKGMFERAASIIQASSDLDGVLILDASAVSNGQSSQGKDTDQSSAEKGTDSSDESLSGADAQANDLMSIEGSKSLRRSTTKRCQILGFASHKEAVIGHPILETDLKSMFQLFPNGKIFQFTANGESTSSTEDSDQSTGNEIGPDAVPRPTYKRRNIFDRLQRTQSAIVAALPGSRSVAFVPLWDFDRSRWFAGCICWTKRPERLLSPRVDLLYFKVFGNTIMNELARLDAIASAKLKTSFVASMSHELRSPLHGILGSVQFVRDTELDSFQVTMLNSMMACSQTLLDTLDNVLDYAKLNTGKRVVSSIRLKGNRTVQLAAKQLKTRRQAGTSSTDPCVDLALATEEVVEAAFAGQLFIPVSQSQNKADVQSPTQTNSDGNDPLSAQPPSARKNCFIALELADHDDWRYCLPGGLWRRILLNLFGNALKYTESGYIKVSLRIGRSDTGATTPVSLHITDTGIGMSADYLANKMFQPFSQEDPYSSGTGLGLSIVRQLIETVGGKIDVTSSPSEGTQVVVKFALAKPEAPPIPSPQKAQLLAALPRLEGRSVCILHQTCEEPGVPAISDDRTSMMHFTDALSTTLKRWLKMDVVHTSEWYGHSAELVICPQPSFEYLHAIRRRRKPGAKAPTTIFVAMDGLEAATLRSDARILNKESVVEIITQPCGPHKLASLLMHCLDRYGAPNENVPRPPSVSASPRTLPVHLRTPSTQLPAVSPMASPATSKTPFTPPPERLDTSEMQLVDAVIPNPDTSLLTSKDREISHLLIVDDNPINRKLLTALMHKHKFAYQEAVNGLEAIEAYQQNGSKFDVILMDISMPVMDGMTATRAIRDYERKNSIKRATIIALTGLASASARLEAWSSGVDHFMTKPVNFKALEELLGRDKR